MSDKPGGMEIMLRSMGLGGAIDAATQLVESGAVAKIIAFADSLPEILERLETIERILKSDRNFQFGAVGERDIEPDPGSADGGTDATGTTLALEGTPAKRSGARRANGSDTGKPVDDGR